MRNVVNMVDLFAGPGGLGEGFSAFGRGTDKAGFRIRMSVEMEPAAHKTLGLRAFLRQFDEPPWDYYDYLRGVISRQELFSRYRSEAAEASAETLHGPRELGKEEDDRLIHTQLRSMKRKYGGQWIVTGGPPCQAYSLVGRARNRGIRGYRPEEDKRHFLYTEYLKVLRIVRPQAFVMENVKGILSSKVGEQRVFPRLVEDLTCPAVALGGSSTRTGRYRIYSFVTGKLIDDSGTLGADCVIRCEDFGVAQTRHRVILLGIREDITGIPDILREPSTQPTVGETIADLREIRSGLSRSGDSDAEWRSEVSAQARIVSGELKQHGLSSEVLERAVKKANRLHTRGGNYVAGKKKFRGPPHLADWLLDGKIGGFLNHESKAHMATDLGRYLYCSSYAAQCDGASPRANAFPEVFAPDHKSWESGKFADRFKVQSRNRPSSTIVSHIAKDGHYYIHPDPGQCRSLTVREAARLQTFPDNYFFEGNKTQQYVQVGNAVPPWLAYQLADIVAGVML